MAKEIFHVARSEGRYQYGLKATADPQGNVTLTPHTNDHAGAIGIDDAASYAIAVQKSNYAGRNVTLEYGGSLIPITADADAGSIVANYGSGNYPRQPETPLRG